MTTITIELTDERLAQLRVLAKRAGISPDEFIRRQVDELLSTPDAAFSAAAKHVLHKNSELYRRLA